MTSLLASDKFPLKRTDLIDHVRYGGDISTLFLRAKKFGIESKTIEGGAIVGKEYGLWKCLAAATWGPYGWKETDVCQTYHRSEGKYYVNHIKRYHLGMTGSLKKWITGAFLHLSLMLILNSASQIEQNED
jgi:hypothetical protein